MDANKATEIVQSLTVADILKAYSGKPGCACGCRGNYRVTAANRKEADVDTGYAYSDDEVNDRQVTRVLREIQAAAAHIEYAVDLNKADGDAHWNVDDDLYYVTAQVSPSRVYTVYLTSAARRSRGVTQGYALR
jgi:hypothetical protein